MSVVAIKSALRLTRGPRVAGPLLVAVLVASLVFLVPAGNARAHANLSRANPAPNSQLDQAPQQVVAWFSEPLEPELTEIHVLDASGERVGRGDLTHRGSPPKAAAVSLPELENGTYTVSWKNVSTVDGHRIRGSFLFSIGEPISGEDDLPPEPILTNPSDPYLRWAVTLGTLALAGGLLLELIVWRPGLSHAVLGRPGKSALLSGMRRRAGLLHAATFVLLAAASALHLVSQTASTFEVTWLDAAGRPAWEVLTGTEWGKWWALRVLLTVATAALLAARLAVGRRNDDSLEESTVPKGWSALTVLGLLAAFGALAPIALISHAGATPGLEWQALASDYLHLAGAAAWAGGLLHLAVVVLPSALRMGGATQQMFLSSTVPRFSVLAIVGAGALAASGIYSAWAQVSVIPALAVPYGIVLLVKLALIIPLLVLAVVNHRWIRDRLATEERAGVWLKRTVAGEAVLAVTVVLLAGFLTSMEPARQVAAQRGLGLPEAFTDSDTSEGARIEIRVEPARVGANRLEVRLENRRGEPITNATEVVARVRYMEKDLGDTRLSLPHEGQGVYAVDDATVQLVGVWQVAVEVVRPDNFDARTAFRFEVLSGAGSNSSALDPSPNLGMALFGAEIAVIGVILLAIGIPLGGWWERRGAVFTGAGMASGVAGVILIAWVQFVAPAPVSSQTNPFPPTGESLEQGRQIYANNCQSCHGVSGDGSGPAADGLVPPPANLRAHVPLHSQGELFEIIANGVDGTAMGPNKDALSDEGIWHLINYLQTIPDDDGTANSTRTLQPAR
ncbi:MAG: copper resistance protein CopC [Chloroflexota bacterium]